jgi:cytochrome P450
MHNWLPYLQKRYGLGDIFYFDLWPLGPRFCFMSDPEIVSQFITTGQSLPKSYLETNFLNKFLGKNNMVSIEGGHWKSLRSMFNPGFSPGHLMTLVPYIVDATMVFHEVLEQKASSGDVFEMEEHATRLTIDIIGRIVLDSDLNSQKGAHPLVQTFRARSALMPNETTIYPWDGFNPLRELKLRANGRKLDALIGKELDRKFQERRENQSGSKPKSWKDRKKTVVDLAIDAYEKELEESGVPASQRSAEMSKGFRADVIDSMKTFLFAGHDTTASTVAYMFYCMRLHPHVYHKFTQELDRVFGTNASTSQIAQKIKEDPHIINQLEYGNAIIKETLRIFPPASTMRYIPHTSDPSRMMYVPDKKTGRQYPISGWTVWPTVHLVGRNEDFFPEPLKFVPERFIQSQTPYPDTQLFTERGRDAYRPFEKGPRSCIGQELALIELRVATALVLRDFDFVAEFNGVKVEKWPAMDMIEEFKDGRSGTERRTVEGHHCYQILKAAAKPKDGMPGRISVRS